MRCAVLALIAACGGGHPRVHAGPPAPPDPRPATISCETVSDGAACGVDESCTPVGGCSFECRDGTWHAGEHCTASEPAQPEVDGRDVTKALEGFADRACACADRGDRACGKAIVDDLLALAARSRNVNGDQDRAAVAARKMGECLVRIDPALIDELRKL